MSEDKNLTNNSQSEFEEIRRKKVENFRMHIDTSSPSVLNNGLNNETNNSHNSSSNRNVERRSKNGPSGNRSSGSSNRSGGKKSRSYAGIQKGNMDERLMRSRIANDAGGYEEVEGFSEIGSHFGEENIAPSNLKPSYGSDSYSKQPFDGGEEAKSRYDAVRPEDRTPIENPSELDNNISENTSRAEVYNTQETRMEDNFRIPKKSDLTNNPASFQDPDYAAGKKVKQNPLTPQNNENSGKKTVEVVSDIHGVVSDRNFERGAFVYDGRYTKKQIRTLKRKEKKRQKKNKRFFRLIWLAGTLVMGILLAQFLLLGFNDMLAVKRTVDTTVHIEIGPNPTVDEIAKTLQENNVIDSQLFFKLYVAVTNSGDGFRQGSFDINTNMDYEQIVNYMQSNSNRTDIVTVRLSEGMNVLEIADKLEEEGVLTDRKKFFELLNSDVFDDDFPFLQNVSDEGKYYRLEGYLFPDTYDFYVNEDPETTIWRFLDNFEKRIIYREYEDDHYDKEVTIEKMINDSEYSMDEIIIIASIIQAEAGDVEDMYNVSSVLHNRLNSHIDEGLSRLECDSTVYYPYRSKSSIPDDMEDYVSRYNTYSIYGLPAGAICNPSLDAIKAALFPSSTNYYYFCHSAATDDSPSVAYYATNYDDHYNNLIAAGLVEQ